jgi:NADH-quinone oxidoreductase subunit D
VAVARTPPESLRPNQSRRWPTLDVLSPTPSELAPHSDNPDLLEINLGPNHPSTHGVLRLVTTLDGEIVVGVRCEVGYVHTGIEKNMEQKTYWKATTYVPRMDYLSFFSGETAFCMAVEKLLGLEVPRRAEWIRVLFQELNRIHSHLVFLGTGSVDLGGVALLFYCFRERDYVLDLFEMAGGQRMHPRYCQVGGVAEDLPKAFEAECRKFVTMMRERIDEYDGLIGANPIWLERLRGVGVIPPDFALKMSLSGPNLRASGIPYDLRTANGGYGAYRELDYTPVVHTDGDSNARFRVRIEEMRSSLDLIEKVLDGLPAGPFMTDDRKVRLPPRHELHTSMESLIHHFKFVTEGYPVPAGEVYCPIESPRGEFGFYLVSDGGPRPWRVRLRGPSFVHLESLAAVANGHYLADLIAILASLDPVLGDVDR